MQRAAHVLGVDDVRRLDHARERDAAVGDVQRVVGAHAAPHAHHEADDAEVAAVSRGRPRPRGRGPSSGAVCGRSSVEITWSCARSRASESTPTARPPLETIACTGGVPQDALPPRRSIASPSASTRRLVAAVERAHHLLRGLVARAGHAARCATTGRWRAGRRSGRRTSSRAAGARAAPTARRPQMRTSQSSIGVSSSGSWSDSTWQRATNATSRMRSTRRRPGNPSSSRGRGHRGEPALVVEAHAAAAEAEAVAQPELRGELDHALVRGQGHVVVAVDRDAAERRGAGEAAELARRARRRSRSCRAWASR